MTSAPAAALYSTDFNLNDLKVYAVGEGILAPLNQWYFEVINDQQTCATSSFNSGESENEANCKCRMRGDTCLDIFVSSRAEKYSGIGAGSSWPDECIDNYTLKEHFANGKFIDSIYYVIIECPPGFLCRNGACVSRLNISIGASKNVVFADNGTILSAEILTVNGQVLRDVVNLDLGDMVYNATSFIYLDQEYRDAVNIAMNNSLIFADSLNFSGYGIKNISGLSIYGTGYVSEILHEKIIEDSIWQQFGILMSGIGNDGVIVHNPTNRAAGFLIENPYDGLMVEVKLGAGESLLFWDDNGNMTIRGSINIKILAGPESSFSLKGNNGAVNMYRKGALMHYELRDVAAYFESRFYKEIFQTKLISYAELSYQLGFVCIAMSRESSYRYLDLRKQESSFGLDNMYEQKYRLCLAKKTGAAFQDYDALIDFINHNASMQRAITYLRPRDGFQPVYESGSKRQAMLRLDSDNYLADLLLLGTGYAGISSSYFGIAIGGSKLLRIYDSQKSPAIRSIKSEGMDFQISEQVLRLSSRAELTAFGPLTSAQKRFEEELK